MKNAGEIIKTGVILCIITTVAACLLGYTNSVTAPIIEQNTIEKQNEAMQAVLSEADDFEEVTEIPEVEDGAEITSVYKALAGGETIGVCVMVSPNGYGGAIEMAVGVDTDGTVTGMDIISLSETAGLGANANKDEFKAQYVGKTAGVAVSKNGASGNEIDALSGATITSRAVTLGVNTAISAAESVLSGETADAVSSATSTEDADEAEEIEDTDESETADAETTDTADDTEGAM